MNKQEIIDFFNRLAPEWDSGMIRSDMKISSILTYAGVGKGVRVLDVACGTGVLFPDYLSRGVCRVVGVDISSAMVDIARSKISDPLVEVLCADVLDIEFEEDFDCAVVYNAFPHFPDPARLLERLSSFVRVGGRVTVAHGMSRAWIDSHHGNSASKVSIGLLPENDLAKLFAPYCDIDTVISNDDMYVVSGTVLERVALHEGTVNAFSFSR